MIFFSGSEICRNRFRVSFCQFLVRTEHLKLISNYYLEEVHHHVESRVRDRTEPMSLSPRKDSNFICYFLQTCTNKIWKYPLQQLLTDGRLIFLQFLFVTDLSLFKIRQIGASFLIMSSVQKLVKHLL